MYENQWALVRWKILFTNYTYTNHNMYKVDLVSNNLQWFICYKKNWPNKQYVKSTVLIYNQLNKYEEDSHIDWQLYCEISADNSAIYYLSFLIQPHENAALHRIDEIHFFLTKRK